MECLSESRLIKCLSESRLIKCLRVDPESAVNQKTQQLGGIKLIIKQQSYIWPNLIDVLLLILVVSVRSLAMKLAYISGINFMTVMEKICKIPNLSKLNNDRIS